MSETTPNVFRNAFQQLAALTRLVLDTQSVFHEDSDGFSRASEEWSERYRSLIEKVQQLLVEAAGEDLPEWKAAQLAEQAVHLCKEIARTVEGNRTQAAKDDRIASAIEQADREIRHAMRDRAEVDGIKVDYSPAYRLVEEAERFFESGNEAAANNCCRRVYETVRHCVGRARAQLYIQKLDALRREHGDKIDTPEVQDALRRCEDMLARNDGQGAFKAAKKANKLARARLRALLEQ